MFLFHEDIVTPKFHNYNFDSLAGLAPLKSQILNDGLEGHNEEELCLVQMVK